MGTKTILQHCNYSAIIDSFIDFLNKTNEKEVLAEAIVPLVKDVWDMADIGAGTGELTKFLTIDRKIIAIEPCLDYLSLLKQNLVGRNYHIIPKKIEQVDFPSHSLDGVIFSHSLAYIEDCKESIRRAFNWLKPGGVGIFVVLAREGDQSQIIKDFWPIIHPELPLLFLNPSADNIEMWLSELGQSVIRKTVTSKIHLSLKEEITELIAFILETSPANLGDITEKATNHFRINLLGEYEINTVHEILSFEKMI
jgi:SAM-dependent methyltransferase